MCSLHRLSYRLSLHATLHTTLHAEQLIKHIDICISVVIFESLRAFDYLLYSPIRFAILNIWKDVIHSLKLLMYGIPARGCSECSLQSPTRIIMQLLRRLLIQFNLHSLENHLMHACYVTQENLIIKYSRNSL